MDGGNGLLLKIENVYSGPVEFFSFLSTVHTEEIGNVKYTEKTPMNIIAGSIIHNSLINSKHTTYLVVMASRLLLPYQLEEIKATVMQTLALYNIQKFKRL